MFIHLEELSPTKKYSIESTTLPSGRWYTVNINDQTHKYPSITTVLGSGPKPWLEAWKKSLGPKKAKQETERCSERGSVVHDTIERYLNNDDVNLNELAVPHRKMFNQMKPRLNRINNIYTQEEALFSEQFKIAGRVDCIGEYDGEVSIIDFKTSTGVKKEDQIQDYYLQCTAYALMFYELYGILIPNITILMGTDKGMFPLVFKEQVENFILPLTQRINKYYKDLQ